MLITTTDILQGYNVEYIGPVAVGTLNAKDKGAIEDRPLRIAQGTMSVLSELLTNEAEKMGANAVIGMDVHQFGSLTYAFGTAVQTTKKDATA